MRWKIVGVTGIGGQWRLLSWPVLVVHGGAVGEPGGPPAERADGDDGVLTHGQYGQVDDGVLSRQELNVPQSMCRHVLEAPVHVVTAHNE